MLALSTLSLLAAFAAPSFAAPSKVSGDCNIATAKPDIPAGSAFAAPTTTPSYIGIALGVQNYTCNATSSTYVNVGAVAELLDASCLYGTSGYSAAQDLAYNLWKGAPSSFTAQNLISFISSTPLNIYPALGQHYYVTNPVTGTGVSPKWDFTSSGATKGNADAYVIAAKITSFTAPTAGGNRTDIDWVLLNKVQGDLADTILRVDTKGGAAPTSCTPGSADISVKYSATYWLYGGSVKK